jgi:hypothetical protein
LVKKMAELCGASVSLQSLPRPYTLQIPQTGVV